MNGINYECGRCRNGINDAKDVKYVHLGLRLRLLKNFITWKTCLGNMMALARL